MDSKQNIPPQARRVYAPAATVATALALTFACSLAEASCQDGRRHCEGVAPPPAPSQEEWTFTRELAAPATYRAREGYVLRDEYGLSGRTATVASDLRRFLSTASRPAAKTLTLRRGAVAGRESYRVDVLPGGDVSLVAEDDDGIRRAACWFEDRVNAGDLAPVVRKPWLRDRISRCFFSPIKRPPFNHDELMDDVDYYPPEYLNRLAHEGINGMWLTVEWRDVAETPFTRRSPDADRRLAKLRRTVDRCLDYGIRTWLFCIEPRRCSDGEEPYAGHPEIFGGEIGGCHVTCPAAPGARSYIEAAVKDVFSRVPGLGGVMMISHGERATTCLSLFDPVGGGISRYADRVCERCRALEPWRIHNWTAESIVRGMRSAGSPGRYISWLYQPQVESLRAPWVADVARHLPDGVAMAYNFESGVVADQLGRPRRGGDYWLSQIGPADGFRAVAEAGREAGAPIYAKIQVGNSHECATVPFVPTPGLLYRKYRRMRECGVSGVLQCWYFGNYPGVMNKAAGELAFETFETGEEDFLRRLAAPEWGNSANVVADVWRSLSDAYSNYPLSNCMQYYGPFHAGVAWPLSADVELAPLARTWKPLEPPSGDAIGECLENHTLVEAAALAKTMSEKARTCGGALDTLSAAFADDKERMRDIGVMRALGLLFESAADVFGFYLARARAVEASRFGRDSAAAMAAVGEMRTALRREKDVSAKMCALAEADSRLGFHSEAEAHQFHPALLRWRIGKLAAEEARLDEIEAGLSAGRPYPPSEHERTAPSFAAGETVTGPDGFSFSARFLPSGDLEASGLNPAGKPLDLRLLDACATLWPMHLRLSRGGWEDVSGAMASHGIDVRGYETAADGAGWRFRVAIGSGSWEGSAALRPAWLHFSSSGAALWPRRPNADNRNRLRLGSVPPSAYGRIEVKCGELAASAAQTRSPSVAIADVGGVPRIVLDGVPVAGTAVMPCPKAAPGTSVDALAKFADVGIRFSSDVWTMNDPRYTLKQWWLGDGKYDWELFDRLARGLLDASTDGMIFPRIKIDPPGGWDGFEIDSPEWRIMYRRMMKDMVRHVEASDYADRVLGYHLGALHCGEWLRKPTPDQLPPVSEDGSFAARKAAIDAFTSKIAEASVQASLALRELVGRRKLIGSFWGYVGFSHEKFQDVLKRGDYDFFAAPPHYRDTREPGHSGMSQVHYADSFRLHGKIFYEESDFRSVLSDPACAPQGQTRMRSVAETVNLIRRSVGKCLCGGYENWWFLLGGNRTFDAPEMMEAIRIGAEEERRTLLTAVWRPAEVAVFTASDEYATSLMSPDGEFRIAYRHAPHRVVLPTCGVPYDSYELADIAHPKLPDYKVYVFLNAFSVGDGMRDKIRERVAGPGKTAVWIRSRGVDGARNVRFDAPPDAKTYRATFREAGAHVWCETPEVITAGRGYLMVHATSDGEKTIRLPGRYNVDELFGQSPHRLGADKIVEPMKLGETRVWRLAKPKGEE